MTSIEETHSWTYSIGLRMKTEEFLYAVFYEPKFFNFFLSSFTSHEKMKQDFWLNQAQ